MGNKFILMGNGPYLNHGCEAIVKGTVNILDEYFENTEYVNATIFSSKQEFLNQSSTEKNDKVNTDAIFGYKYNETKMEKLIAKIGRKIRYHVNTCKVSQLDDIKKHLEVKPKAIISVGGDNYSLDYGYPDRFTTIDRFAYENNIPLVIWGASIGPFTQDKVYERKIAKHLNQAQAIFAREDKTVDYLKSIGVENNVYRICDPAFHLPCIMPKDDTKFIISDNAIGFNVSPLMPKYCGVSKEQFIKRTVEIINDLLDKTTAEIYLIPHVNIVSKSDFDLMYEVYSELKINDRVVLVGKDYDACELKWIISQMKLFYGARTHATIAALSMGVPTISFVYSIKALGINKDFFGGDKYCVYPEDYKNDKVTNMIINVLENSEAVKVEIENKLPEIKELSKKSGEYLKKLL